MSRAGRKHAVLASNSHSLNVILSVSPFQICPIGEEIGLIQLRIVHWSTDGESESSWLSTQREYN